MAHLIDLCKNKSIKVMDEGRRMNTHWKALSLKR
jgi:hypothetical protein